MTINWKKMLIGIKVFAPILIKGLVELWNELLDAYDKNNLDKLAQVREETEYINECLKKN